ncbi:hypothetical protein H0H92_013090 [Tricholoma furcatifolium]|nr:hypothetical protein H0H92_013090 [Tricholoma furcatifolium]
MHMPQTVDERRANHILACQRYRERNPDKSRASAKERMRRNPDKSRASAKERMRRLRERRKEEIAASSDLYRPADTTALQPAHSIECPSQSSRGALFLEGNVASAVARAESALRAGNNDFLDVDSDRVQMRSLSDVLPPSSEPEYSDSDESDIHYLPPVTTSSDDEDHCGDFIHEDDTSSINEERSVVEATRRLAAAQEALTSAESMRSKVMAIPLKKRGGGTANKQNATRLYQSALQAFNARKAELAILTQDLTQITRPSADPGQVATLDMDVDQAQGVENDVEAQDKGLDDDVQDLDDDVQDLDDDDGTDAIQDGTDAEFEDADGDFIHDEDGIEEQNGDQGDGPDYKDDIGDGMSVMEEDRPVEDGEDEVEVEDRFEDGEVVFEDEEDEVVGAVEEGVQNESESEDRVGTGVGSNMDQDFTMDADAVYPGQSQDESQSMEVVDIDEEDTIRTIYLSPEKR